jgi:hypothetical protein
MNSTSSTPVGNEKQVVRTVLPQAGNTQAVERSTRANSGQPTAGKAAGYGLPCAKCKTYYAADLKVCPICNGAERVSPLAATPSTVSSIEQLPDPVVLEQERERFLREFKAQVLASQSQFNPAANSRCIKDENHQDSGEPAVVCQACYDHLQERVDVLEAALHMDVKEAAQIVYDAVWADTTDATKTYQNAAHALLAELRKRSGVTPIFGLLQPLTD